MTNAAAGTRTQDLLLTWLAIAEAGVIQHRDLSALLKRDAYFLERYNGFATTRDRQNFATNLSRDLDDLELASLIDRSLEGKNRWIRLAQDVPGIFLGRSKREARLEAGQPKGQQAFAEIGRNDRPLPEWAAELQGAIEDLRAACGGGGPGDEMVKRMELAFRTRFGDRTGQRQMTVYRGLLPSFQRSLDAIPMARWDTLYHALRYRYQVQIKLSGVKWERFCSPLRFVWYNGRPRLEVFTTEGGIRRYKHLPLHRIETLTETKRQIDPSDEPTPAEQAIIQGTWGLDLSEDLGRKALPLAERVEHVVLRFRNDGFKAIEEDPGNPDAKLQREVVKGRKTLRYEVDTIVGRYFLRWVRQFGPDVEVLAPEHLRRRIAEEAAAVASQHVTLPPP